MMIYIASPIDIYSQFLSFILFFISDSTSYFGNDGYMSLISRLTNCSSSLIFSSFMFATKLFESLIKHFSDVAMCRNSLTNVLPSEEK